jgi:hypothetical protein
MSWKVRWAGHVAQNGEMTNAYKILVWKDGKRLLRRPRHRWEYNIRMTLRGTWWDSVDWMHLVQDRDLW